MEKTERQKLGLFILCSIFYAVGGLLILLGGILVASYEYVSEFHPFGTILFLCGLVFLLCGSILHHAYIMKFWGEKE